MQLRLEILVSLGSLTFGLLAASFLKDSTVLEKPSVPNTEKKSKRVEAATPNRQNRLLEIVSGQAGEAIKESELLELESQSPAIALMGLLRNSQSRWPNEYVRRRDWPAPAFAIFGLYTTVSGSNRTALCEALQRSLTRGISVTLNPEWALEFLQSRKQISSTTLDNLRISPPLKVEQLRSLFANQSVPNSVLGWCLLESFDWSAGVPPACREFLQSARCPSALLPFMLLAKGKLDEASRMEWPSSVPDMVGMPPSEGLFDPASSNFTWMRGEQLFQWLASRQSTKPASALDHAISWAAFGAGYSEVMTNGSSEALLAKLSELSNPALRRSFAGGAVSQLARRGGADASILVESIRDPASRRGAIEALLPKLEGAAKEAWKRELEALPPLE